MKKDSYALLREKVFNVYQSCKNREHVLTAKKYSDLVKRKIGNDVLGSLELKYICALDLLYYSKFNNIGDKNGSNNERTIG